MIKNNSITMMKIKLLKMKMINKMINSLITIQKNMKLKMMIKKKNQIILKKMNKNKTQRLILIFNLPIKIIFKKDKMLIIQATNNKMMKTIKNKAHKKLSQNNKSYGLWVVDLRNPNLSF